MTPEALILAIGSQKLIEIMGAKLIFQHFRLHMSACLMRCTFVVEPDEGAAFEVEYTPELAEELRLAKVEYLTQKFLRSKGKLCMMIVDDTTYRGLSVSRGGTELKFSASADGCYVNEYKVPEQNHIMLLKRAVNSTTVGELFESLK